MGTQVVTPAESAPATPTPNFDPSTYTPEEHSAWMAKGTVPTTSKPAESTPATEDQQAGAEQSAESNAESAAAAQPSQQEQKGKGAEARKAQLAAEIQDLLKRRAELKAEVEGPKKDANPAESSTAKAETAKLGECPEPLTEAENWGEAGHENETHAEFQKRQAQRNREIMAWEARAALQADRQEAAKKREAETVAEQNRAIEESWKTRVDEFKATKPDFEQKLSTIGKDVPISTVMDAFILDSEVGPGVLYHLCEHPDQAKAIAGMSAFQAARALVKIEESLAGGAATEAPKSPVQPITKAARPATDLRATQAAPVDELKAAIEAGDTAAYMDIMNRRDVERRRGR